MEDICRLGGIIVLFTSAVGALAQPKEEIEHCSVSELFQTELPVLQEKGIFQISLEPEYRSSPEAKEWVVPLAFEYGLSDSWEINAEWAFWNESRPADEPATEGTGDISLGIKHSFHVADTRNHIAVGFDLTIPSGRMGGEFMEYEPSLMFGRDFPDWCGLQLFGEVKMEFVQRVCYQDEEDMEPAAHSIFLSGGCIIPVKDFCLSTELTWVSNQWNHGGTEHQLYVTPGVMWELSDNCQLGIGVPVGLNRTSDQFRISGRVIFEF